MNWLELELNSGDVQVAQQWASQFVGDNEYPNCKLFEAFNRGGVDRYALYNGTGETIFSRAQLQLIAVLLAGGGRKLVLHKETHV